MNNNITDTVKKTKMSYNLVALTGTCYILKKKQKLVSCVESTSISNTWRGCRKIFWGITWFSGGRINRLQQNVRGGGGERRKIDCQ